MYVNNSGQLRARKSEALLDNLYFVVYNVIHFH